MLSLLGVTPNFQEQVVNECILARVLSVAHTVDISLISKLLSYLSFLWGTRYLSNDWAFI